jgi:hypothetical protein
MYVMTPSLGLRSLLTLKRSLLTLYDRSLWALDLLTGHCLTTLRGHPGRPVCGLCVCVCIVHKHTHTHTHMASLVDLYVFCIHTHTHTHT